MLLEYTIQKILGSKVFVVYRVCLKQSLYKIPISGQCEYLLLECLLCFELLWPIFTDKRCGHSADPLFKVRFQHNES